MDAFMAYLRVPSHYAAGMKGLRWAPAGDAVEFGNGSTFAFPGEIFPFLEGFASQRPLIHFAHILHLLYLLKELRTPFLGKQEGVLAQAFSRTERPYRNAGVFCAVLCADIPAVPDPPQLVSQGIFTLEAGASEPFFTLQNGDMPALSGEVFESRVLFALAQHQFEDILHWLRYGRGPVRDAGEAIADTLLLDKPRSLHGVLADLAQLQRLSGVRPFVDQLVSALTLPPRRLERPELPLGGYCDVTTRGQVDQLLPSQFVFDDLEFVRRHAEHELLYFHREDPHVRTREDLVVLLDQGVRAWGAVRLVLTAALFALGRLAERRRIPFLIAATSGGGELLDPLQAAPAELQELIECSDLSPHPGPALERVLSEETDMTRDVVLLTHPRNLTEPAVIAAARQLSGGARMFAVAVDEHGGGCFSEVRSGVALPLNRFHVDLDCTAPPPTPATADPLSPWRGDVEPVPFPFRFGLTAAQKPVHMAFDAAGEWLLIATHGGMLFATRTDGSRTEILPRGLVQSTIVTDVAQVLGVAGGFVVMSVGANQDPYRLVLSHYDLAARTCTVHRFARISHFDSALHSPVGDSPLQAYYLRKLHTVVIQQGKVLACIHLSTGDRNAIPAAIAIPDSETDREWRMDALPVQRANGPDTPEERWSWPWIAFAPNSGAIRLIHTDPPWDRFTPLEDNKPILKERKLEEADCQGLTLAALFTNPQVPGEPAMLRLFRGPEGVPLVAFPRNYLNHCFVLSDDGRLLARQVGQGNVQIREVLDGNRIFHVLAAGRFHSEIQVILGERWLTLRIGGTVHFAYWYHGALVLKTDHWSGKHAELLLKLAVQPDRGVPATLGGCPPDFMPLDSGRRFGPTANNRLLAVVSRFGEVALFERTGELVCMFFAFRKQIAVWMPDGTCYGPMALLGQPATPGALEKIGAALSAAWERETV